MNHPTHNVGVSANPPLDAAYIPNLADAHAILQILVDAVSDLGDQIAELRNELAEVKANQVAS